MINKYLPFFIEFAVAALFFYYIQNKNKHMYTVFESLNKRLTFLTERIVKLEAAIEPAKNVQEPKPITKPITLPTSAEIEEENTNSDD